MFFYLMNRLVGKAAFHEAIECLVAALEARDAYTSGHSLRVADMSSDLGKAIGLRGLKLETVHLAAHLHDIGKLGVPDDVLNKKGRLLPDEWAQIQMHPEIGYNILSKSKGLIHIARIVLYHHERWDGKGYTHGIKGDKIPLGSRIISVADSIDAMTSQRPYREAMSWEKCMDEIVANKGTQFDPMVVEAAERLWRKWKEKEREKGLAIEGV
ncbi:metal dependent phosphohydrolase [Anaerobacterium chartisolvens]|uniref:Metal dependent phosphohydrolase n=1 Tax=Anaerobacterium chartisolvens TaxID=1297424 RepID=A0A369BCY8_9FIRM|nr:metal dependent phosphohydrolase [Anaerobacterium chartisolvens]